MSKKKVIVALLLVASGCSQTRPAKIAMLSDLKLGMQIYEVREIHKKDLTSIGFESHQGYDLVQYRGWFNDGTKNHWSTILEGTEKVKYPVRPYKLTFEVYPPITRIQCQYLAAKNNVTDPNELAALYSIEGLRPSRLIQVILDEAALQRAEAALHRAEIDRQTGAMMWQMQQVQSNQQQMLWNQQQMQNQMQFNNIRRGW